MPSRYFEVKFIASGGLRSEPVCSANMPCMHDDLQEHAMGWGWTAYALVVATQQGTHDPAPDRRAAARGRDTLAWWDGLDGPWHYAGVRGPTRAQVRKKKLFVDLAYNLANGVDHTKDGWFHHSARGSSLIVVFTRFPGGKKSVLSHERKVRAQPSRHEPRVRGLRPDLQLHARTWSMSPNTPHASSWSRWYPPFYEGPRETRGRDAS